jgi:RNA polymerase sigma-70 factor (ECF subfamily)
MTGSIPDTTIDLLAKLRAGDEHARDTLVERAIPPLRRWARGRLPRWARSLADTQDLVQDVVVRALPRLDSFEPKAPGALQAFLRRAINNHIIDEIRKARSHGTADEPLDIQPDPSPSPLEQAISSEGIDKYRAAVETLDPIERELIWARVERQESYSDIAVAFGKPTTDAARMAVNRAIAKLLKAMATSA